MYLAMLSICLSVLKVLSVCSSDVFTITTPGCTIPGFPGVSENIEPFVQPPRNIRTCTENNRLVDSNNTHIWVIKEALDLFNVIYEQEFYCCYRNFSSEDSVENVKYANCYQFSTIIEAKHEFVRVECYYLEDKMYDDFFVFVDVKFKHKTILQGKQDGYNVLIVGIENMSRVNFQRTMPKTAEFLHLKGAVELLGYNKVGDNSYPNLFPLLFGDSFANIKKRCYRDKVFDYHNNCSFIWDKFKNAEYLTALGSDSIMGFLEEYEYALEKPPTDFYLQPFMYESRHLFKNQFYGYHRCLGSKYTYEILLKYIKDLTSNLKNKRLFGIFWEESISHEDLNYPHIMDLDYLNLLFHLEDKSYLNDTIIIFLSDHGMRWGPILQTEQGRLEERLPLLQVLFPSSFKRRYRQAFNNFYSNRQRLTTPYDMYETLSDLRKPFSLNNDQIKDRSLSLDSTKQSSLFLPISNMRTCESVGIKEHWCTCYNGKKLKITNRNRILAAEHIITHLNELLRRYPCQQLRLKNVLQATMVHSGKDRIYNIIFETIPGGGIFDGTLERTRDNWVISGTVSRLNLYRNDSCIDDNLVKMYCYCNK